MSNIKKAYAISDAKISFVSLVDKAANKRQFLITKADGDAISFQSFGNIIKTDPDSHYVTGIVYEPMAEDSQGNYMTEEEITKAAHWFMKNSGAVDIQHCFEKADNCEVVESFVAKSDMEIDGTKIAKGTWMMTVEITDPGIWEKITKGEMTGFSMGGVGVYSAEDVDLQSLMKSEEPSGLLRKLAKALGFDVVEKGAVKTAYGKRIKEENFYAAWYALKNTLEGNFYNTETGSWEYGYNSDENAIKEALSDFNDIVTQLLASNNGVIKSLEKAAKDMPEDIKKAGKSLSNKNFEALKEIHTSLTNFLSSFEESDENKKEETEVKKEEIQKIVSEEIEKAMQPMKSLISEISKEDDTEDISKMVGEEVAKALEPINKALEPILRSRALPGNLNNNDGEVQKQEVEQHYMHGIF